MLLQKTRPKARRRERISKHCESGCVRPHVDVSDHKIDILRARYTAGLPFAQNELDELGLEQIGLRAGELVSVFIASPR
jgi:hypothetical protein